MQRKNQEREDSSYVGNNAERAEDSDKEMTAGQRQDFGFQ